MLYCSVPDNVSVSDNATVYLTMLQITVYLAVLLLHNFPDFHSFTIFDFVWIVSTVHLAVFNKKLQ